MTYDVARSEAEEFRIIHSMCVVSGTVWCVDGMTNVPYFINEREEAAFYEK